MVFFFFFFILRVLLASTNEMELEDAKKQTRLFFDLYEERNSFIY